MGAGVAGAPDVRYPGSGPAGAEKQAAARGRNADRSTGQGAEVSEARIEMLRKMLETRPNDPRARFGLALEYERQERWEQVVEQLTLYLAQTQDEGNAYGRLARALIRLDREEEARAAYRDGIAAATRHGHPTMAMELEEELDELG